MTKLFCVTGWEISALLQNGVFKKMLEDAELMTSINEHFVCNSSLNSWLSKKLDSLTARLVRIWNTGAARWFVCRDV